MMAVGCMTLNNGKQMPMVGLGTWRSSPEIATQAIKDAIDIGYRHIDCAHIYGNEAQVGAAIAQKIDDGVISREQLFITSKLWNTHHNPTMVRAACEKTLKDLGLRYLDNYLMHWPTAFKDGDEPYPLDSNGKTVFADHDYIDTWRAMEALVNTGLCRSIGICNFNQTQLERLIKSARIQPANLQIEINPYLNQKALVDFCQRRCIAVTAYSPLGSGHTPYEKPGEYALLDHPTVHEIATAHCRSCAQIVLRYQIQRRIVVIPRSVTKSHMAANLKICDFELTPDEMKRIDAMDFKGRFMLFKAAIGHPHYPFEVPAPTTTAEDDE